MLTSLIGVVVLLGGLIFFHELGHYGVAKLFGVKVEVFSMGFGKKIFSRKIGETEYCLALIPFGGYVKMMGDDPFKGVPAGEAERSFSTQKLYKRFLIVAAGPIANLLLAYVLFCIVFFSGQPMVGTTIGSVSINSPAWQAGFRSKDRILEVGGVVVSTWNDFEDILKPKVNEKVELKLARGTTELRLPIEVNKIRAKNAYGEDEEVGGLKGVAPNPFAAVVGVSDPKSLAYVAGLRTGDTLIKIETKTILVYEDINEALTSVWAAEKPISISYKRKPSPEADAKGLPEQVVSITLPKLPNEMSALGAAEVLGLIPAEVFVRQINPDSPAEKGGLKVGDRILKFGDESAFNFEMIVDHVQARGAKNETVILTVEREGQQVVLNLKPVETTHEDPLTRQSYKRHLVGFSPLTVLHEPEYTTLQIREPIKLVTHAISETNELAKKMVISLVKLAMGDISVKNLGGPVLIATVAGKSLDAGIIPFLQMMALISINLFLLNLFPVPVLDGGHLFFFTIEAIKGKPVSVRTMEIANQVGMVLILMLVALTLFNDISRLFH